MSKIFWKGYGFFSLLLTIWVKILVKIQVKT